MLVYPFELDGIWGGCDLSAALEPSSYFLLSEDSEFGPQAGPSGRSHVACRVKRIQQLPRLPWLFGGVPVVRGFGNRYHCGVRTWRFILIHLEPDLSLVGWVAKKTLDSIALQSVTQWRAFKISILLQNLVSLSLWLLCGEIWCKGIRG